MGSIFSSCTSEDKDFAAIDTDGSHTLAKEEMHIFIENHEQVKLFAQKLKRSSWNTTVALKRRN
jgi:hypothetical protein